MPPARNQQVTVRRRSFAHSNPIYTSANIGRTRASKSNAIRLIQVDTKAGIVHDVIAGPPCECALTTPFCREVRRLPMRTAYRRSLRFFRKVQVKGNLANWVSKLGKWSRRFAHPILYNSFAEGA